MLILLTCTVLLLVGLWIGWAYLAKKRTSDIDLGESPDESPGSSVISTEANDDQPNATQLPISVDALPDDPPAPEVMRPSTVDELPTDDPESPEEATMGDVESSDAPWGEGFALSEDEIYEPVEQPTNGQGVETSEEAESLERQSASPLTPEELLTRPDVSASEPTPGATVGEQRAGHEPPVAEAEVCQAAVMQEGLPVEPPPPEAGTAIKAEVPALPSAPEEATNQADRETGNGLESGLDETTDEPPQSAEAEPPSSDPTIPPEPTMAPEWCSSAPVSSETPTGLEEGTTDADLVEDPALDSAIDQETDESLQVTEAEPLSFETTIEREPIRAPKYRPPAPVSPAAPTETVRRPRPEQDAPVDRDAELHLRVHIVFDRHGGIRTLELIPDRRAGMSEEVKVTGTQGDLTLFQLREECYEGVALPDASTALRGGVEWRAKEMTARNWHWVLGGRDLYVLAPGDDAGFSGFVSTSRLLLQAEHVVLATETLQSDVQSALAEAGCSGYVVLDSGVHGIPPGWVLFRGVKPTRPVAARDESNILNALCPLADIEPHFVGGIRLERSTWLLGHPPRIAFTGDTSHDFEVMIDGRPAIPHSDDGGYQAPGWDSEGDHQLWFADRTVTYSLSRSEESWATWSAYDFDTHAVVCGALTLPRDEAYNKQVIVHAKNPVLIGPEAGQILKHTRSSNVRAERFVAFVPFRPVWALPVDPIHTDKRTARILLAGYPQRVRTKHIKHSTKTERRRIEDWCAAINDAGRKGLALAADAESLVNLWQDYRRAAKRTWRQMR